MKYFKTHDNKFVYKLYNRTESNNYEFIEFNIFDYSIRFDYDNIQVFSDCIEIDKEEYEYLITEIRNLLRFL